MTGGKRQDYELGPLTTLGRDPTNTISLADPSVSRKHASVRRTPEGRFLLVDLSSTHGTFVGGRRITEKLLSDGDEIQFGSTRLRFEDHEARGFSAEDVRIAVESRELVQQRLTVLPDEPFQSAEAIADVGELRRDYERLRVGLELTRAIGVEHELSTLLERILATAFQLLRADRGAIILVDPENGRPTHRVARRRSGEKTELVLSTSIVNEVMARKEAVVTADAVADARFGRADSIMAQGIRSAMCVPMLYQEELLGIMQLDSQIAAGVFGKKDLELFTSIANQAALAIKNATLVQRIQTVMAEEWKRLDRVIRGLPEGVLLLDVRERIVLANPRAEALLPLLTSARKGSRLTELGSASLEHILAQEGKALEVVVAGPPRRIFAISAAAAQQGTSEMETVVLIRDITEEHEQDERASRQERLALIGQLAGGIAHDFNNLLLLILSYSGFLAKEVREPRQREDTEEIQRAALRAADLTRQLLAFSRRGVVLPVVLSLNRLVADMEKLLRRTLGEHVRLSTKLASDLWRVKADPGKLEQVVLNLIVNARDAMLDGGTLTLETQNADLDAEAARRAEGLTAGRYVVCTVADTGCGMTPEILGRIFEPFFTTKEKGKGTGLGLATVYGIVQQAGGGISVSSEPGVGSTFRVYLPATDEALSAHRVGGDALAPRGGQETVIIAEDEGDVRGLASRVLRQAGYTVLEAGRGAEALRMCEGHPGPVHLLLADVVMPEMSGKELAGRLLQAREGMRVLYMSGYADETIAHHGVLREGIDFLPKPFTPDQLLMRVREVLDG
jgi:signal transduction histidine kinase